MGAGGGSDYTASGIESFDTDYTVSACSFLGVAIQPLASRFAARAIQPLPDLVCALRGDYTASGIALSNAGSTASANPRGVVKVGGADSSGQGLASSRRNRRP